jgi:DNA-binding beta-propeller fold protein YncE
MITTLIAIVALGQSAPLVAGPTYKLPRDGRFDYMLVDSRYNRVFASHPAAKTLAVLDLGTGKTRDIETGQVNGVQIDEALGKVFTGGGEDGILVRLDRKTLNIEKKIDLGGAGDDIVVDPKRQQVYVCHDEAKDVWVFDAKDLSKVGTVAVAGAPEYILYFAGTDKLYQNIKPTNQLQVIDPETKTVVASWDTGDEKGPHGLAIDEKTGIAFSAGSNGKLSVFDLNAGKLLTTVDIVAHTDQIAFDQGLQRVYCAGAGAITVVQETPGGATVLGNVPDSAGAHTIAVDQKKHTVWICYSNSSGAYFQSFTPQG